RLNGGAASNVLTAECAEGRAQRMQREKMLFFWRLRQATGMIGPDLPALPSALSSPKRGFIASEPIAALVPATAKVKLAVTEGLRAGKNYALKEGVTYVGRQGTTPVDIDLSEQENPGASVAVNRFALVWFDAKGLAIADTGRGVTKVNGNRIPS